MSLFRICIYLIPVFFSDQTKFFMFVQVQCTSTIIFDDDCHFDPERSESLNTLMFNTAKIGCNCVLLYLVIIIMIKKNFLNIHKVISRFYT